MNIKLVKQRRLKPVIRRVGGRWYAFGGSCFEDFIKAEKHCTRMNRQAGVPPTNITEAGGRE